MRYEILREEGLKRLKAAGIAEASVDTDLLFMDSLGLTRSTYFFKKQEEVPADMADRVELFFERIKRREKHEPVQYILGNQDFYGLTFMVNKNVLIPRLDTEVLVDTILHDGCHKGAVLDLCTGSGCIVVTLKGIGNFEMAVGTDISAEALEVARQNSYLNHAKVTFLQGDLYEALENSELRDARFDVIVSNPPYIAEAEKPSLAPEVIDNEPHLALFAENEGLIFYERIIAKAADYLKDDGRLYFEIGCTQAAAVREMCIAAGFGNVTIIKDLAGLDRVVRACR